MNNETKPVDADLLHKKRYGKHTMTNPIINCRFCVESCSRPFFHYTSPEGLKSILKNRSIYFTDCQFLNDSQERLSINMELNKFWTYNSDNYDEKFVRILKNVQITEYEDDGFIYSEKHLPYGMKGEKVRYYVLSCSLHPDCLNLWKYYSKNNDYNGYCIGLANYALSDEWIDRENDIAVINGGVIYDTETKQMKIREAVDELYSYWCKYKVSEQYNEKIKNDFQSWLELSSLFFKQIHFQDEYEYRFVAITPISNLKNLFELGIYDFRLVNGVLTPFLNMPFNNWNKDECWVVNSIKIGPTNNKQQKELGLKLYMNSLEYTFPDCSISHSNIPLRY